MKATGLQAFRRAWVGFLGHSHCRLKTHWDVLLCRGPVLNRGKFIYTTFQGSRWYQIRACSLPTVLPAQTFFVFFPPPSCFLMENVGLAGSNTEQGCGSALVSYLLIWHARFHTMFNVSTEPRLIITVNNYRLGWYAHLQKKKLDVRCNHIRKNHLAPSVQPSQL